MVGGGGGGGGGGRGGGRVGGSYDEPHIKVEPFPKSFLPRVYHNGIVHIF